MTRCLTLINLLFLLLMAVPSLAQEDSIAEYRVEIEARNRVITGICAIGRQPAGTLAGTIVNEMGMKAFDFRFDGKKVRLENVFPPINKWYIKRVLRKDMLLLLSNIGSRTNAEKGKRSLTFDNDGGMRLQNNRFHIVYSFSKLQRIP